MTPSEIRRNKLQNFFSTQEDEKEFAQLMRKFIFQSSMLALKADVNKMSPDKETISEGCMFLQDLCETLDPVEATDTIQ